MRYRYGLYAAGLFLFVCLAMSWAPLLNVVSLAMSPLGLGSAENWQHIVDHALWEATANSLVLALAVAFVATCLGTVLAWWLCFVKINLRAMWTVLLALPIAFPPYVLAYLYYSIFNVGLSFTSRNLPFVNEFSFASMPPLLSSIGVLSLCLYPYAYLMMLSVFLAMGQRSIESLQILNVRSRFALFKECIYLTWPWSLAASLVIAMECLADFGVASIFMLPTLPLLVFRSWTSLFEPVLAFRLSLTLAAFSLVLVLLHRKLSYRQQLFTMGLKSLDTGSLKIPAWSQAMIQFCFILIAFFATFLPVGQLVGWILRAWTWIAWTQEGYALLITSLQTVFVGVVTAVMCVALAFISVALLRYYRLLSWDWVLRLQGLGYSLPGVVIAVGCLAMLVNLQGFWPLELSALSLLLWIFALVIKFLFIANLYLYQAQQQMSPRFEEVLSVHGATFRSSWTLLYLPHLWPAMIISVVLVFIDVVKELPISLMLRPIGWQTLSIRVFEFTSEGDWLRAALPALLVVILALPALYLGLRDIYRGFRS